MTWRASAWAKKLRTGAPARKAVLMALAEEVDVWGWCFYPAEMLAPDADLKSTKHCYRVTRWLAEAGLIEIYQGRGTRGQKINLYRLHKFGVDPKAGPIPQGHASRDPRFQRLDIGPESKPAEPGRRITFEGLAKAEPRDKSGVGPKGQKWSRPRDIWSQAKGHFRPSQGTPRSLIPRVPRIPSQRARGAPADPEGAGAPRAEGTENHKPTCSPCAAGAEAGGDAEARAANAEARAHWQACQTLLQRKLAEQEGEGWATTWRALFEDLICFRGTPDWLGIACRDRPHADRMIRDFAELIGQVTGRRCFFQAKDWCAEAAGKRKQQEQREQREAKTT